MLAKARAHAFATQVAPLLAKHCLECHDSANKKGGLNRSRKAAAFAGGDGDIVIKPGKAAESLLWDSVVSNEMPKDRPPLSDDEKGKKFGSASCSHEWWHDFDEKKKIEALSAHARMKMWEIAYVLGRLDDKDSIDANGKSILDNALITVSTESGDRRHNDVKRELSGVFHANSGAGGRCKTGNILDICAEVIDVYNTMLTAMGCTNCLGPEKREAKSVDAIRT